MYGYELIGIAGHLWLAQRGDWGLRSVHWVEGLSYLPIEKKKGEV